MERQKEDLSWCNGDLMRFIYAHVPRTFSVMDIDCFQYKAYKNGKEVFRIIEAKHNNEQLSKMQNIVLVKMCEHFKVLNSIYDNKKFEVYIINADALKEKNYLIEKAVITNMMTGATKTLFDDQVKKFLELEFKV